MKNLIVKIFVLLLVLFCGITLVSCDEETKSTNYNNTVPTGTLSDSVEYASLGNYKLTQKGLYAQLRSNGFDYLFDEMIKLLVTPETYNLSTLNNLEE